jgi:PAS domain S-box-containing protein
VIETANAPIFGVDLKGKVTVWNKCAADVTSFSSAEVMGKQLVQQFISEDFRTSVQHVLDRALQGEETANFEFPIITKTLTKVQILLNATPRRDEFGHVIGMVGIGQNITARIAQEQEYSKLIDTANAPIFGVDISGKVTVWNKCAANISGYSSEDTMGHNLVQEFITEDFRASVQEVLDKALKGLEDSGFAFPLVTKDGRRLEILLNATSRRDVDGHIVGMVGIGQDITARLAQEQEYSRLIDTANAPIFGVDVDGKVNVWNKCAQALTGYMAQDVFGKDLVSIVTSQYKESVQTVLENAVGGQETANFEFPLIHKDGSK